MKLRVVISCSRSLESLVKRVKEVFIKYCETARMENPEITVCLDGEYFLNKRPQQYDFNKEISKCDVFVCLSALKGHIGKITADETYIAYEHYINNGQFPLCLLLSPKEKTDIKIDKETDITISDFLEKLDQISPKGFREPENEQEKERYYHYFFDFKNEDTLYEDITNRMNKASKLNLFHLHKLSCHGKDIEPKDIMPDGRATEEQGYGEKYFFRPKVDGNLKNLLKDDSTKILLIRGKALSGKSRAVYQYINKNLKEERIVLIRRENLKDVMDCLFQKNDQGLLEEITQHSPEKYYFIFDEVDKLIGDATSIETLNRLFSCIKYSPSYYAILTSTILGAEITLNKLGSVLSGDGFNRLEIAPLDINKFEDRKFINICINYFTSLQHTGDTVVRPTGDTVGIFNPTLQSSIQKRINDVRNAKDDNYYFHHLFRTYAMLQIYRFNSVHYMGIFLYNVRKLMGNGWNENGILNYLNKLIGAGILCINRGTDTNDPFSELKFNDFRHEREYTLEDNSKETMIMSPKLLYTVDDSIWDSIRDEYIGILNGNLEDTLDDFLKINTDNESFCKAITRSRDKHRAWQHMKDYYLNRYLSDEKVSLEDKIYFMNIMIQYTSSLKELKETMIFMKEEYKYEYTGDTLAVLLSFYLVGKNQKKFNEEELKEILDYEAELRDTNPDIQLTYYYHQRRIQLMNSFKEMWEYYLQNKDFLVFPKTERLVQRLNLIAIFQILLENVQLPEDFKTLLEIFRDNKIEVNKYSLTQVIKNNQNDASALKEIGVILLGDTFPVNLDNNLYLSNLKLNEDKTIFLDYIVGNLIKNSPDFKTAQGFFRYLPEDSITVVQLSQLFKKCARFDYDFNIAKNLLKEIAENRHIDSLLYLNKNVFNTLLQQATTLDDALSVISLMKEKDNFTLNNFLGVIKRYVNNVNDRYKKRLNDSIRQFCNSCESPCYLSPSQKCKNCKKISDNKHQSFFCRICKRLELYNNRENKIILEKMLSDIKNLYFANISPEGFIQSDKFQGVKIDLYTINSLYELFYEYDRLWVDNLVNKIHGMKDKLEQNPIFYSLQIKNADDFPTLKEIIQKYLSFLEKEDTSEMELRQSDMLNSIYTWLRHHKLNKEDYEQLQDLLKNPAFNRVVKDHFWLTSYFTSKPEMIFTSDRKDLSKEFKEYATKIELTSSYPFKIIIRHFAKNYEEMRLIYDFALSLLNDRKASFRLDDAYMIEVIKKCRTLELYEWVFAECKNQNIPMTYSLWSSLRLSSNDLSSEPLHATPGNKIEESFEKEFELFGLIEHGNIQVDQIIDKIQACLKEGFKPSPKLLSKAFSKIVENTKDSCKKSPHSRLTNGLTIQAREKLTQRVSSFLKEHKENINCGLFFYNNLFEFYYPSDLKEALYEQIRDEGYHPDSNTYRLFITDVMLPIETNREFYNLYSEKYGISLDYTYGLLWSEVYHLLILPPQEVLDVSGVLVLLEQLKNVKGPNISSYVFDLFYCWLFTIGPKKLQDAYNYKYGSLKIQKGKDTIVRKSFFFSYFYRRLKNSPEQQKQWLESALFFRAAHYIQP